MPERWRCGGGGGKSGADAATHTAALKARRRAATLSAGADTHCGGAVGRVESGWVLTAVHPEEADDHHAPDANLFTGPRAAATAHAHRATFTTPEQLEQHLEVERERERERSPRSGAQREFAQEKSCGWTADAWNHGWNGRRGKGLPPRPRSRSCGGRALLPATRSRSSGPLGALLSSPALDVRLMTALQVLQVLREGRTVG